MDGPKVDGSPDMVEVTPNYVSWQECEDVFIPAIRSHAEFLNTVEVIASKSAEAASAFIDSSAFQKLKRESSADISREHGGILLGHAFKDEGFGFYVIIREIIPAQETAGSSVHLRFREQSWQPVWKRLEERPELQVVGWYHTHPGLGVFMSGTDLNTQRLYFRQPWQVAIVVDPIRKKFGLFLGELGRRCSAAIFTDKQQSIPSERDNL